MRGVGGDRHTKKVSLVNWRTVTRLNGEGGLGLKNTRNLNVAFLAKLGWRVVREKERPWAQVITKRYMKKDDCMHGKQEEKERRFHHLERYMCCSTIYNKRDKEMVRNGRDTPTFGQIDRLGIDRSKNG